MALASMGDGQRETAQLAARKTLLVIGPTQGCDGRLRTTGLTLRSRCGSLTKADQRRSPGGGGTHASSVPSSRLARTFSRSGILRTRSTPGSRVCAATKQHHSDAHSLTPAYCSRPYNSCSCERMPASRRLLPRAQLRYHHAFPCTHMVERWTGFVTAPHGTVVTHWDRDLAATSAMRRSWLAAACRTALRPRTRGFLAGAAAS